MPAQFSQTHIDVPPTEGLTPAARGLSIALSATWLLAWWVLGSVEMAFAIHDPRSSWDELAVLNLSQLLPGLLFLRWPPLLQSNGAPLQTRVLRQLLWWPLLVLAFLVVLHGLRSLPALLDGQHYVPRPMSLDLRYAAFKVGVFYALWLGIAIAVRNLDLAQRQAQQLLAAQAALARAQLQQLRAQLQPHFLFNALNTISALMAEDVRRADALLNRLAELLRAVLTLDDREMHPLGEELSLLERYAGIMVERFGDRLTLNWQVDPSAVTASVPVLLLQPLLENAFRYGIEACPGPQQVAIYVEAIDGRCRVRIRNSGQPLPSGSGAGVGLRNIRERLAAHYGDEARLTLHTVDAGCIEACVEWPASAPT